MRVAIEQDYSYEDNRYEIGSDCYSNRLSIYTIVSPGITTVQPRISQVRRLNHENDCHSYAGIALI